jgi:hypothetical protein
MSTVKRRLFNVLAAGSLALCLAMLGLWVNSRWRHDAIGEIKGVGSHWFTPCP